jgi:23S rRNA pseudouridine2605 synthase
MLQTMKRNNRDNSGYGKSSGRGGNYKSTRNEGAENDRRSSTNRFFGDREDKGSRSEKPAYNTKSDGYGNSERGRKPYAGQARNEGSRDGRTPYKRRDGETEGRRYDAGNKNPRRGFDGDKPGRPYGDTGAPKRFSSDKRERQDSRSKPYGGERSEKSYGRTPSEGKFHSKNSEHRVEPKRASYKFGSEWKEKPSGSRNDNRFSAGREERNSLESKGHNRFDPERSDKRSDGELKTVYKGRGRDQKPRYETVRKDESPEKTSNKKFFSKSREVFSEPAAAKPQYDLKKYEQQFQKNKLDDEIRLNKYIANAGVCSRREADTLIENGMISVNGTVVKELGFKVSRKDKVQYQGRILNPEKPVYLLLNKPKDFITTTDDPMERKTVMSLVNNACEERIFPVGRLDRNTTGLLLFTNDGELADKLASPANKIKKIYQVTLDKPLTKNDAEAILEGLTLEDGPVKVDDMQVLSLDRTILGLEIHLGRNRIVRRIFAHLGYEVTALDRVVYAGLNKKDIPRGKYRFLTEKEVVNLKFFS